MPRANSVERTPDGHAPSVGRRRAIPAPGEEVEPVALRQPYVGLAPSGGFIHRFRDGRGRSSVPNMYSLGTWYAASMSGDPQYMGSTRGKACPGCAPVHGVEVRNHAMAQAERIVHDRTPGGSSMVPCRRTASSWNAGGFGLNTPSWYQRVLNVAADVAVTDFDAGP